MTESVTSSRYDAPISVGTLRSRHKAKHATKTGMPARMTWLSESSILTSEALFRAICGPLTQPMNSSARQSLRSVAPCAPRYLSPNNITGSSASEPKAM
eukprot:5189048-Prymnesium_polylepis.1